MRGPIILSLLTFASCKFLFAILSWFMRVHQFDHKRWHTVWQQLRTEPSVLHTLTACFVARLQDTCSALLSSFTSLLGLWLLHFCSFPIALEAMAFLESLVFEVPYQLGDGVWQFVFIDAADRGWPLWWYALASFLAVGLDIGSILVTVYVLSRATRATAVFRLLGLLGLDWALMVGMLIGGSSLLAVSAAALLSRNLHYTDFVFSLILCTGVALPTLAYHWLLWVGLCVRWLPAWLERLLTRLIDYVEPRTSSVVSSIGTLFGFLVSVLVAVLTVLAS